MSKTHYYAPVASKPQHFSKEIKKYTPPNLCAHEILYKSKSSNLQQIWASVDSWLVFYVKNNWGIYWLLGISLFFGNRYLVFHLHTVWGLWASLGDAQIFIWAFEVLARMILLHKAAKAWQDMPLCVICCVLAKQGLWWS